MLPTTKQKRGTSAMMNPLDLEMARRHGADLIREAEAHRKAREAEGTEGRTRAERRISLAPVRTMAASFVPLAIAATLGLAVAGAGPVVA
jgi:hypothetical protein